LDWAQLLTGDAVERKQLLAQACSGLESSENRAPDTVRHLIRAFEECEWRSTRLDILRSLHHFPDSRTISFLQSVIAQPRDPKETQYALRALARMKNPWAWKGVLRAAIHLGPEDNAAVADALSMVPTADAKQELIRRFQESNLETDAEDLVHLVLALSTHRVLEVVPTWKKWIEQLLVSGKSFDLLHSMVVAMGLVSVDPRDLLDLTVFFENVDDPLLWNSFRTSLTQIRSRGSVALIPDSVPELTFPSDDLGVWSKFALENPDHKDCPLKFLKNYSAQVDDAEKVKWINAWQLWAGLKPQSFQTFWDKETSEIVLARWVRAHAEIGHEMKIAPEVFIRAKTSILRSSILQAFSESSVIAATDAWLKQLQIASLADASLNEGFLAVLVRHGIAPLPKEIEKGILKQFSERKVLHPYLMLELMQRVPLEQGLDFVIECSKSAEIRMALRATLTLGSYKRSAVAIERLKVLIQDPRLSVRGRALDSLVKSELSSARLVLIDALIANPSDTELVDLLYRRLKPLPQEAQKGIGDKLHLLLEKYPGHHVWEKLVALRDRFGYAVESGATDEHPLDAEILQRLPEFKEFEPIIKAALRSAECTLNAQTGGAGAVDLAPVIVEYAKCVDLLLERRLGQKFVFPLVESKSEEIRKVFHQVGLLEKFVSLERLFTQLGLDGKFDPEQFPIHKAKVLAGAIGDGSFAEDRYKLLDGLRTWAAVILILVRPVPGRPKWYPMTFVGAGASESDLLDLARILMKLQDLRNPAAHRQTYLDSKVVESIRKDAVWAMQKIVQWF
jgi:hypothetical protein